MNRKNLYDRCREIDLLDIPLQEKIENMVNIGNELVKNLSNVKYIIVNNENKFKLSTHRKRRVFYTFQNDIELQVEYDCPGCDFCDTDM